MKKSFPLIRLGCVAAVCAASPWVSRATVVTLDYSAPWAGPVHPNTGPLLRATLSDVGAFSTSVNFLLEPLAMATGEYVNNWGFNFSGAVSGLTFLFTPPTGFDLPTLQIPAGTMGGGNPPFDFSLAFSTSGAGGGAHRFQNGESLSFTVFRSGGGLLTVDDFLESISFAGQDLLSGVFFAGGATSYHYKGELQPPPPPVTEPTTLAFGGLLIAGLAFAEARRRRASVQPDIAAVPA